MREWRLHRDRLPSLILAADARFCIPNYVDDQIWELNLSSGEPAALSLRTTYGLRVRSMRMYPKFIEGDDNVSDPGEFAEPPAFRKFFPNYALITCSPFPGLDAVFEYWVARSYKIGGRIRLFNTGVTPRSLRFEWTASMVTAEEEDERLKPQLMEGVYVLTGKAANLVPVIFFSGGTEAKSSPSTALTISLDLLPGLSKTYYWGHAATPGLERSFQFARNFASHHWDEEIGRIEMVNQSALQIETGNTDWDTAFTLGQNVAKSLIHGPTEFLPHPSFVHTRLPDQGYSLRGDGRDYDHLWNGQNVLETWHLCSQLLPSDPETAQKLLENFLSTQDTDGAIDWQPSLNGLKSGTLATPLLCSLAWRIFKITGDRVWLIKYFPKLQKFIQHWFSQDHDRDHDGIPEWDHPMQTGFEDNPFFAHWNDWAQGADINDFESPSLTGMLYAECDSLIRIAHEINYVASIPALEEKCARLRASLDKAWDPTANVYRYRDRDTHDSPSGMVLTRQEGPGMIIMTERTFSPEARLSIRIRRSAEAAREPVIRIIGERQDGQTEEETIPTGVIRWALNWGSAISEQVYHSVKTIHVEGIDQDDEVVVQTIDYRHVDQTLLAPLWAGVPDAEKAESLVKKAIIHPTRFWREHGIAACATLPAPEASSDCESIWVPWNCLIGEGLMRYGYKNAAAEIVSRLMDAIVMNVRKSGTFRKTYHAHTGAGIGERNSVLGLPPLDLFLSTLGVRIESPWRVHLSGENPYPWPVKIGLRGLEIRRYEKSTEITFPNGEMITVDSTDPCTVDGR